MISRDFVFEELARVFDTPCDYSPMDDYMVEHCKKWCEKFCGIVDADKCWEKYFSVREREEIKKKQLERD